MTRSTKVRTVGVAALLFVAGGVAGSQLAAPTADPAAEPELRACEDGGPLISDELCEAQGALYVGSFYNIQGAAQFCKWKAANPGEWARVKTYISTGAEASVVTWFGSSLRDQVKAYLAALGPMKPMPVNDVPNVCRTPLAPPTNVQEG